MAKVTTYKNSKFATFCSFLGYIAILFGCYSFFEEEIGIVVGIIAVAIGLALKILAGFIAEKKSKRDAKRNQKV